MLCCAHVQVEDRIEAYNMDGGAFVRTAVVQAWDHPIPPRKLKLKSNRRTPAPASEPTPVVPAEAAPEPSQLVDHFIMNLPATAIEFLGCYRGLYRLLLDRPGFMETVQTPTGERTPLVHCYCFSNAPEGAHVQQICEVCPLSTSCTLSCS